MNSGSDAEDPGLEQAGCIKRVREERRGVDSGLRGVDETRSAESTSSSETYRSQDLNFSFQNPEHKVKAG